MTAPTGQQTPQCLNTEFQRTGTTAKVANLPMAHTSVIDYFSSIIDKTAISARTCRFFQKDMLYVYYGAPYYRVKEKLSQNDTGLPIAFLFHPNVIRQMSLFFPFDTGAALSNMFGAFQVQASGIMDFSIQNVHDKTITLLLHLLFKTNQQYRTGEFVDFRSHGPCFEKLFNLYNTDLTPTGVDHRKYILECHSFKDIPLNDSLIWMAFPKTYMTLFEQLLDKIEPHIPEYYAYPTHMVRDPKALCALIHERANEYSNRYYER